MDSSILQNNIIGYIHCITYIYNSNHRVANNKALTAKKYNSNLTGVIYSNIYDVIPLFYSCNQWSSLCLNISP